MFHPTSATLLATLFTAACLANPCLAATPSIDQLWEIVQQQQASIEMLQARLAATDSRIESTEETAEAAVEYIETIELPGSSPSWTDRTALGGYGELHYNNLDSNKEIDFHRFVLYFSHEFTDSIRLFSEFELEHALTEDTADGSGSGEVELEQAWLEFDLTSEHRLRAGLDILPIGITNWTHEPPTFFGVERNRVENVIIPTTWLEAVLGFNGEVAPGWNYDLYVHSGLDAPVTGGNAFRIRSGRQKVAKADPHDAAVTGRLRYTGYPGLEIGVSGQYQQDLTQGDGGFDIDATLIEGHIALRRGNFGIKALGARWDLDDGPAGIGPASNGRDEQYGYYLEPALYFDAPGRLPGEVGLFARYSRVDDRAGNDADTDIEELVAGLNYWPTPNTVIKFDVQNEIDGDDVDDNDGFNLGLGYSF